MEFNVWMQRVDGVLMGLIMMGHDDIPDMCWRDQYEDGATPQEAVSCLVGDTIEQAMESCM